MNIKDIQFSERFKEGDSIYFWFPKYGGCNHSKIQKYSEQHKAYLTTSSLYVREGDLIFDTLEELEEYGDTHKHKIVKYNGCGYSFGCDFL